MAFNCIVISLAGVNWKDVSGSGGRRSQLWRLHRHPARIGDKARPAGSLEGRQGMAPNHRIGPLAGMVLLPVGPLSNHPGSGLPARLGKQGYPTTTHTAEGPPADVLSGL